MSNNAMNTAFMQANNLTCESQIDYASVAYTMFFNGWKAVVEKLQDAHMHRIVAIDYSLNSQVVAGVINNAINFCDE